MRPPRLTTRQLMGVVALLAVGLGLAMTWRRQADHLAQAERYLSTWRQDQALLDGYKNSAWMAQYRGQSKDPAIREGRSAQFWRGEAIRAELGVVYALRRIEHHRQMLQKHLRAASRPWSVVPPDPAPPAWPDRKESTTWLLSEMGRKASQPVATPRPLE